MQAHRTTKCNDFGHREITLQLAAPMKIPNAHGALLDYFERAVARGTKFLPEQTIRFGWSTLMLCDRSDGTIGVQERALTPKLQWIETVDRALRNVWYQQQVVSSVGLDDEISFPAEDDHFMVAECVNEAPVGMPLVLTRLAADDLPERFSGWTLSCADDHDHGERKFLPLLALASTHPGLVQFLALPHDTLVFVGFAAKENLPAGTARIEPHVFRDGDELAPKPGSYLAALQA
jgi:hypothetical protein